MNIYKTKKHYIYLQSILKQGVFSKGTNITKLEGLGGKTSGRFVEQEAHA
jgi:hypothetical protein